jgi:hypothetical protein
MAQGFAGTVPSKITDGTNTATVRDLAANDALNVAIVDGAGDQITSFGGGTQYTEGDTDASITGTAMMMEGAGNALVAAPGSAADGLLVNLGSNNDVTVTGTVTANIAAGTNNIGDVDVLTVPAPLSTTGGGTEATALRVTLATDSTGVLSVDDNGSSITIDGTVTVSSESLSPTASSASSSGDNTIFTPGGGQSSRVYYLALSADGGNSADVTAIVKFGAGGSAKYKVSLKPGSMFARNIGAGKRYMQGAANEALIVNLSAAQTVHVSVEAESV